VWNFSFNFGSVFRCNAMVSINLTVARNNTTPWLPLNGGLWSSRRSRASLRLLLVLMSPQSRELCLSISLLSDDAISPTEWIIIRSLKQHWDQSDSLSRSGICVKASKREDVDNDCSASWFQKSTIFFPVDDLSNWNTTFHLQTMLFSFRCNEQ